MTDPSPSTDSSSESIDPQATMLPASARVLMALANRQAAKSGQPTDWRLWLILALSAYSASGIDLSMMLG